MFRLAGGYGVCLWLSGGGVEVDGCVRLCE
jgi:hypothetical protein